VGNKPERQKSDRFFRLGDIANRNGSDLPPLPPDDAIEWTEFDRIWLRTVKIKAD
jgi:hypothetical protein